MDGKVYAFHDAKRGQPSAGPLSGTWYGQVTLGGQTERLTLVLVQRQARVDGVLRLQSTLAGGFRGTLQGEKLTYTAQLLGDCKAEFKGEAVARPQELQGRFEVKDCQGRSAQGRFRATRWAPGTQPRSSPFLLRGSEPARGRSTTHPTGCDLRRRRPSPGRVVGPVGRARGAANPLTERRDA